MNGTSTADKIGVKVCKQPGGGCSDIFGPPIIVEHQSRQTNNTKSTIFLPPETGSPSPNRPRVPQEDTKNKLFGEPEPLVPPVGNGESTDDVGKVVRVRQPPGGVSSKLW